MSEYKAMIRWSRNAALFIDGKYSRAHAWKFDDGLEVPASASPHVVPRPMSIEKAVDPEEAFVAALSSCHMLWFLSLAAKQGFIVDSYVDEAIGVMEPVHDGKLAITRVTLHPHADFSGTMIPTGEALNALHHQAHEECFIARSVNANVRCEPI